MNSSQDDQFDAGKDLWAALDSWEPEPISMDFNRRLFRRIHAQEQQRKFCWRSPLIPAFLCLFLAFLLLSKPYLKNSAPAVETTVSNQKFNSQAVHDGQTVAQTLSDLSMLRVINSSVVAE